MKVCNSPDGCDCTEFNKDFCKWYSSPKKKAKSKRIKPMSEKREAESKVYSTLRKVFLTGKRCVVYPHLEAVDVHHSMGRVGYADDWARERNIPLINDVRHFLACSREGHDWIHSHPVEAREKGWLI